jgi:hypothetical protein
MENNAHAGQGAVLLDIGGDIGAVVITMPVGMLGVEVEIAPVGGRAHGHSHHDHDHDHGHPHPHAHPHLVHVGVVNRPRDGRGGAPVPTAVFGEVREGEYEVYERPDGPTALVVSVRGGAVTELVWPEA